MTVSFRNSRALWQLGILLLLAICILLSFAPRISPLPPKSQTKPAVVPEHRRTAPIPPPVDLHALSERLSPAVATLTDAQVREDEQTVASQVSDAAEALRDINIGERVGGALQLGAYPTREAEKLLIGALEGDVEAEVRIAAAQSLAHVRHPQRTTLDALIRSLEDENEEVEEATLGTIMHHIQHLDPSSASHKHLLTELKKRARSKRVANDTREAVRNFLADQ